MWWDANISSASNRAITHLPATWRTISCVITARKRSLEQGNIFTSVCQEFCSQGGSLLSGGGPGPWGSAPRRGCLVQGGAWSGEGVPAPGGAYSRGCLVQGVCSRGVHGPRGCLVWGMPALGGPHLLPGRGCLVPPTATAADGTHPTGMHSC